MFNHSRFYHSLVEINDFVNHGCFWQLLLLLFITSILSMMYESTTEVYAVFFLLVSGWEETLSKSFSFFYILVRALTTFILQFVIFSYFAQSRGCWCQHFFGCKMFSSKPCQPIYRWNRSSMLIKVSYGSMV